MTAAVLCETVSRNFGEVSAVDAVNFESGGGARATAREDPSSSGD